MGRDRSLQACPGKRQGQKKKNRWDGDTVKHQMICHIMFQSKFHVHAAQYVSKNVHRQKILLVPCLHFFLRLFFFLHLIWVSAASITERRPSSIHLATTRRLSARDKQQKTRQKHLKHGIDAKCSYWRLIDCFIHSTSHFSRFRFT